MCGMVWARLRPCKSPHLVNGACKSGLNHQSICYRHHVGFSPVLSFSGLPAALNDSTSLRQSMPDDAYEKALSFLYGQINYEKMTVSSANRYRFRLQRMSELLEELGLGHYLYSLSSPKPPIPLIHIAGTKGKGSVAAMVAAMLTASGLRTGLYTSPHLHRLEERFRVDGETCPPEHLVALVEELSQAVESPTFRGDSNFPKEGPSFFELTTALALLHFERSHCEAIVLEVGLGGRLDSTNVCAPSISVVTSIGLDHQHVLGNDLTQIAAEKAGIIKQGVPVVSGVMDPAAQQVVESTAIEHRCTYWQLGRDFQFQGSEEAFWGSRLVYTGPGDPGKHIEISVPLEGTHQCRNAAIALATVEALGRQGSPLSDAAIDKGLAGLICPGRIEPFSLSDDVMAVVDVAHNEDSVAALCDCLRNRRGNRNIAVVFGTSVDKSAEVMLKQLSSISEEIVLTRFHGNPRFVEPSELAPMLPDGWSGTAEAMTDPIAACEKALARISPGGILVVCGSFFLAAETRPWIVARSQ
ncbi:MAG: bifunctional folylpolyglutamate synthase/dihydrofolate synthase [Rhodopirellula sp.]|nr:bifunctional folylpolyglutamate synthase/dihydrofolate synthase [Rhodopirellula sp.]